MPRVVLDAFRLISASPPRLRRPKSVLVSTTALAMKGVLRARMARSWADRFVSFIIIIP
ncbi:hypothetical protein D3C72_2115310 [compost metagenome]